MNTKKLVMATLGAALLVGAAAPASFAAPGRDGPERDGHRDGMGRHGERAMMQDVMFVRLLKTADANKDAKISKEEVAAYQEQLFTKIDADKDGSLTPGEFRAYRKAEREEFRANNPRPERAERREERKEQKMAENGDRPDRAERHGTDGPRHGMRNGGGHGGGMGGFRLIRMADTDENGQFSKVEITAAADKLFARMDRNKDGVISIDDMPDRPL
jgi:hypothetical protein